MHINKPKLRWPINVNTHLIDGQHVIVLSCPIGVCSQPLALNAAIGPILAKFEGKETVEEIANLYSQQGATPELVLELAKLLDQNLFLESPSFYAAEKSVINNFKVSSVRESALAGLTYPANPEILTKEIDSFLKHGSILKFRDDLKLACLVAPHIDYKRGGSAYGKAYSAIKNLSHDLYILIGTSHKYSKLTFHLTKKDFNSPLGTLKCDKHFITSIAEKHGIERSFENEFLHKNEHSLELQLPFLKRQITIPKIAPILVGSFYKFLQSKVNPQDDEEYESFINALCESVENKRAEGNSLCFIAGVDMAHIGQEFGDSKRLSPEFLVEVKHQDQIYLDTILSQDKQSLFEHIKHDNDARRICGFPTMYTILDIMDRLNIKCESQVFDYNQAVNYERDCAVSFASIGMYER